MMFLKTHKTYKKCLMAVMAGLLMSSTFAWAVVDEKAVQKTTGVKTVIVDFDRVKRESRLYKEVIAAQSNYEKQLEAEIKQDVADIEKEGKALQDKKPADHTAEVVLQKKAAHLQQKYQLKAQQIMAASHAALEDKEGIMKKALEVVADRNGAGVVLNASVVLYANDMTNNVTDDFIKELDQTTGTVKYPDPNTMNVGE